MPSSSPHIIGKVLETLISLQPSSLLDVGAGFGKYGMLCREYLDYKSYPKFKKRIDAIEGFKKYITPIHSFAYNKCFVGDARKIISRLSHPYDIVLLIDVLEDLTKEDGSALVKEILKRNKSLLITIPKVCWNENAEFGNSYEIFRSDWSERGIRSLGKGVLIPDYSHYIYFIGSREQRRALRVSIIKHFIKKSLYSMPFATSIRRLRTGFSTEKSKNLEHMFTEKHRRRVTTRTNP